MIISTISVAEDRVCRVILVCDIKEALCEGQFRTLILALPPTSHVILGRTHHLAGSAASVKQEGLDQIILKAPSSSNLLGSILSREPHLWGRGNRNILSAQIQPRHMPAQPRPHF